MWYEIIRYPWLQYNCRGKNYDNPFYPTKLLLNNERHNLSALKIITNITESNQFKINYPDFIYTLKWYCHFRRIGYVTRTVVCTQD